MGEYSTVVGATARRKLKKIHAPNAVAGLHGSDKLCVVPPGVTHDRYNSHEYLELGATVGSETSH